MAERRKPTKGDPKFIAGESGSGETVDHFGGRRSHHGNKPGGILGDPNAPNYDPTSGPSDHTMPAGQRGGDAEDKDIARGIAERTVPRKKA